MQRRSWVRLGITVGLVLGSLPLILSSIEPEHQASMKPQGFGPKEIYRSASIDLMESPPPPMMELAGSPSAARSPKVSKPGEPDLGPKMIRTADLTLEVADPLAARREILARLTMAKGWAAEQAEERDEDGHVAVRLQLRLPAEAFEATEQGFRSLGKVVEARTQTEDVSRQWVDREARLAVKRAAVVRLKQLLAQRTASLKDLLEAEKALVRETEEIESLEAVHRLQERQVAFATLNLLLQGPRPRVSQAAYSPLERFGERVVTRFGASLAVLGLFLTTLLPWAALAGLAYFIHRRRRRIVAAEEIP